MSNAETLKKFELGLSMCVRVWGEGCVDVSEYAWIREYAISKIIPRGGSDMEQGLAKFHIILHLCPFSIGSIVKISINQGPNHVYLFS